MSKRKALVIGIDDYPGKSKLHCCANDALAIADLLEYNEDGSRNFDIRKPQIRDQSSLKMHIEELFKGKGDVALLYFAGHGTRNETGGYLVTPDYDDCSLGVSMTDLASIMSNSKWTNKIAILDCCSAGAMGDFTSAEETCILKDGMTIMSACDRDESATECDGHGIFTDLLIEGLKGVRLIFRVPLPQVAYTHISINHWEHGVKDQSLRQMYRISSVFVESLRRLIGRRYQKQLRCSKTVKVYSGWTLRSSLQTIPITKTN